MGLALSVGFMQELRENDPETYEDYRGYFEHLNRALLVEGLPSHREPDEVAPEHRISFDMFGYSGLHYLRRIAAHKTFAGVLPPPGDDQSSEDALLQRYYRETNIKWSRTPARPFRRLAVLLRNGSLTTHPLRFDHLIDHSDCEAFYLPIHFGKVFAARLAPEGVWQQIGSSYKLLEECKELTEFLGIPDGINPESDEMWEAPDNQGKGEGWKRYGIESFTCVRLMRACEASVASGAAVVFS